MYQDSLMNKRQKKNYFILLYLCLLFMLVASILDRNGFLNFVVFIMDLLFCIAVTKSYNSVLFFLVALLPNFSLLTGGMFGLSINRIIFFIGLVVFIIDAKKIPKIVRDEKVFLLLLLWLIYFVFELLTKESGGILRIVSIAIYVFMGMAAISRTIYNEVNREKLCIAYIVGMSFIIFVACFELCIGKTFFYSLWTGGERFRNGILRPGSTVADPNNICFMIIPFLFLLNCSGMKKVVSKRFARIIMILGGIVVFCTSSRTGLVALVVGVTFVIISKRKAIFLLTVPVIGLAANYILSFLDNLINNQYSSSATFRYYMVEAGLKVWSNNKFFGVGSTNFSTSLQSVDKSGIISSTANTMNTYVYTLVCYGLIGMAFFVMLWFLIARKDIVDWLGNKTISKDTVIRLAAVLVLLIIAYTLDTYYMLPMWIMPALFILLRRDLT